MLRFWHRRTHRPTTLLDQHSAATLSRWARDLKHFRYVRAADADEDDLLLAALPYADMAELTRLFTHLGHVAVVYAQAPQSVRHSACCQLSTALAAPALIDGSRWIKQPGHCRLFGQDMFVWCQDGRLSIRANPHSDRVRPEHIAAAMQLEARLAGLPLRFIDPPQTQGLCLCPRDYPAYFPFQDAAP